MQEDLMETVGGGAPSSPARCAAVTGCAAASAVCVRRPPTGREVAGWISGLAREQIDYPGDDDLSLSIPALSAVDREPATYHFNCCPPLSLCLIIETATSVSRRLPSFTTLPFPSF